MQQEDNLINLLTEKFKVHAKASYFPDQIFINRLIASLDRIETNSYNQSQVGFISEFKYLKGVGVLQSIKKFVYGCLNQLLWINSILESGKHAETIEALEKEFNYKTPNLLGDSWTLDKVTEKGVFFHGAEPFQNSRVIINSGNVIDIAIALSKVLQQNSENMQANNNDQGTSVAMSDQKANDLSLFISKELESKCLNVLKEIPYPVLDINGRFMGKHGMKGAIVIWYDHCKRFGFISKELKNRRDIVAKEVMKIIPNLSIESSNFDKSPKAKLYAEDIKQKLSLLSRK